MVLLLLGVAVVLMAGMGVSVLLGKLMRDASTQAKLQAIKGAAAGAAAATVLLVLVAPTNPGMSEQQERQVRQLRQGADGPVEVIEVFNTPNLQDALEVAEEEGLQVVERIDTSDPLEAPPAKREIVILRAPPAPPAQEATQQDSKEARGLTAAFDGPW